MTDDPDQFLALQGIEYLNFMADVYEVENRKEIIYSLIREEYIPEIKRELEAYFAASKKNACVAFTINLDSIVGVKIYKFLTQTIRG